MDPTAQDVIDHNLDSLSRIARWTGMEEGQWKQLAELLGLSDDEFRPAHPRLICALPEAAFADALSTWRVQTLGGAGPTAAPLRLRMMASLVRSASVAICKAGAASSGSIGAAGAAATGPRLLRYWRASPSR